MVNIISLSLYIYCLVVDLLLWKMMEFVTWDYYSIPNCFWKVIIHSWFQSPPTSINLDIYHIPYMYPYINPYINPCHFGASLTQSSLPGHSYVSDVTVKMWDDEWMPWLPAAFPLSWSISERVVKKKIGMAGWLACYSKTPDNLQKIFQPEADHRRNSTKRHQDIGIHKVLWCFRISGHLCIYIMFTDLS